MMDTIMSMTVLSNPRIIDIENDRPNLEKSLKRRVSDGKLTSEESVIQAIGTRCMRIGSEEGFSSFPLTEEESKQLKTCKIGKGHPVSVYYRHYDRENNVYKTVSHVAAVIIHDANFCRY